MNTLLQFIDNVAGQIGINQPNVVIGNTDPQVIQLLALINQLGQDVLRGYDWQRITKPYYFTTVNAIPGTCNSTGGSNVLTGFHSTSGITVNMVVSGPTVPAYSEVTDVTPSTVTITYPCTTATASASMNFMTQDYSLPADYDRMISDTNWDRTNHWRNLGPKTSQEWQWLQGGIISIGPRERYRVIGNVLRYFNAVATPLNIAYEYVSNRWVFSNGSMYPTASLFSVDTDTCIFSDDVVQYGLKYYWREAKGLDFTMDKARFDRALSICKAQDEPLSAASLASQPLPELVGPWSVADGSWPETTIN